MAAQGDRRGLWTRKATKALIREVKRSPHCADMIAFGKRPRMQAWEAVQARMDQKGYSWEAHQLISRWKYLKSKFYKEQQHQEEHGTPSAKPPAYYGFWQVDPASLQKHLQAAVQNNIQMKQHLDEISRCVNEILGKPSD
ncbi:hypothetical protein JD844_025882 [Phrynosoma platyrhinos]|uniref:Myb/SANT-like DNA-binding domain-containing protein n=1 Tax=Phrynosoma platyrhinos TaxID=52577 RepID=A0ABQ7T057_PHRPL|nr:hypothetical protein JD844_025882 [Phrynosoma platyrhinos]